MNKIKAEYRLPAIQRLIQQLLDAEGISEFELSRRSGLNAATIYNLMNEKSTDRTNDFRGLRRQSLRKIGEALGYKVTFDSERDEVVLERTRDLTRGMDDLENFWTELREVFLQAGKTKLTHDEQGRIKEVVRAMIA